MKFWIFALSTLKVENGQIHAYCMDMYGEIYQNQKGTYNPAYNIPLIGKKKN